jgi:hypothetical protein
MRLPYFWRIAVLLVPLILAACDDDPTDTPPNDVMTGQQIFRFDTFGNETFWTDTLTLHQVIRTAVSPNAALAAGLKVDATRLPPNFPAGLDLDDPATTVELLRLDAVLGVKGTVENNTLTRVGITCALCHSNVDDSVTGGVGARMDGWRNPDLDVGLILSLSPALQDPAVQAVLTSWGPGMYDPRWNHDGINGPVVTPAIYGLSGVDLETYTGEGPISYWNAYVAVTQMHVHGTFVDPNTGDNIVWPDDLVTPKLPALLAYQLSLTKPAPPAGSYDSTAAVRGAAVFNGVAQCATCHVPPTYTDANTRLHDAADNCTDAEYAARGTTGQYRTTPLRGLWQHGPYFHDGRFTTLDAVVEHYDDCRNLNLTTGQKSDLVEFLKSL